MSNPKKIIFILPLLCSGGAERAIITLMNNLDKEKFVPEMIALNSSGPLKNWINKNTILHDLGGVRVSAAYFKLLKKLKERQPDIVITTMAHSNFLLMLLKPFFPKTKFIIREAVVPSAILEAHSSKSFLIKLLYKILYPIADLVISPSQEIIEEFKDQLKMHAKNHVVLHNQVDEHAIHQTMTGNQDFKNERDGASFYFVCAGRLHYQKGYDRLIDALAHFKPAKPWKLVILGEGSERENLEKQIKKNSLQEHVFLYGNQENPWKYISIADCLLLPSRWEGMPNVVLESLACGTKVIASQDANGIKEIQKHSQQGALLSAKDMDEFIALMSYVELKDLQNQRSLLPQEFTKNFIMHKFQSLL